MCPLVLETPTPQVAAGNSLQIDLGGADPNVPCWILVNVRPDQTCYAPPILAPFANPCFPELFPITTVFGPFNSSAAGFATFNLAVPAGAPALNLVFQGATLDAGVVELSTPVTVESGE